MPEAGLGLDDVRGGDVADELGEVEADAAEDFADCVVDGDVEGGGFLDGGGDVGFDASEGSLCCVVMLVLVLGGVCVRFVLYVLYLLFALFALFAFSLCRSAFPDSPSWTCSPQGNSATIR